jgi:predicted esterase
MSTNPDDGLDLTARISHQREDSSPRLDDLYDELWKLKNLRAAYMQVREDFLTFGIDALTVEAIEEEGVEIYLQKLSDDLQARTYQPGAYSTPTPADNASEHSDIITLRDQVIQASLRAVLDPIFVLDLPCDPEPEKAIKWVGNTINRGLTRVYAVHLEEYFDVGQRERLLERVSQRIGDPEVLGLIEKILSSLGQRDPFQCTALAPLLANIAFQEIDHMLQQAKTLGREDTIVHVTCARFADDLILLFDQDQRYDWIQPAVQKRLREELSALQYDMNPTQTQLVDLARGEKLRFLGFELRRATGSHGGSRVQYKRLKKPNYREVKSAHASWYLQWHFPHLEFARRYWSRTPLPQYSQCVQDAFSAISSIQFGWRHLPITMYPVLAVFFGWHSLWALFCAALIVVCNWQSIPVVVRWAWRHRWGALATSCGLTGSVCLYLSISDFSANLSREDPAPHLPPGFYLGQYNSSLDADPVPYGVYVPPHFKDEKGPFPLIVFLHGFGEKRKDLVFSVGVPNYIAHHFGEPADNNRFEFVAFFPIDPTGKWRTGTPEVEDAMKALDYVIVRHHIDPKRVYLTGLSAGGSGVWRLAETYPNRWAAVAPLASFIQPDDVQRVQHIPAWIFHGAKDTSAPVERDRDLVQKLKAARADVRYTESPDKGHSMRWVYNTRELYDWFATKKRED